MTPKQLLTLVETLSPYKGEDVRISYADITSMYPEVSLKEIAEALLEMRDVKITDGVLGGMIIPAKYFEE